MRLYFVLSIELWHHSDHELGLKANSLSSIQGRSCQRKHLAHCYRLQMMMTLTQRMSLPLMMMMKKRRQRRKRTIVKLIEQLVRQLGCSNRSTTCSTQG